MKVIAVVAQKGGTGKTTTAISILDYLSRNRQRTLAIDLNDQGDLTDTLAAEAMTSGAGLVLQGKTVAETAIETNLTGVDILTGAEDLALLESKITAVGKDRAMILKNALRPQHRYYKYVVIDAPGSFNTAFLNALSAADNLIITARPDYYSLRGVNRLIENIQTIRAVNPGLTVDGILLTQYQGRRNITREAVEKLKEMETALNTRLFNATIRENAKTAEAPKFHKSVISYAPGSIGAADYMEFLNEYFNFTGGKQA